MSQRVAIIHDWLTGMRGGEKVLEVFCELFPEADIHTLVHTPKSVSPLIENHRIVTSPLQSFPNAEKWYRYYLPLMPWAIKQLDLSAYDLVISSSHCVAKGVFPPKGAMHICYCHTPMRYVWDQYDHYFGKGRGSLMTRQMMKVLRKPLQRWDKSSSKRVDRFIANSAYVAKRIQTVYERSADVIHPPVNFPFFAERVSPPASGPGGQKEPYYLIVSAFAPYKRLDIAVEAFKRLGKTLFVIGGGQEEHRLRELGGPTIHFLGSLTNEEIRQYYQHCQALIFPSEEDFGIVPLECMASGRPVIAYEKGGALETVVAGVTGTFFAEQTSASIEKAVMDFEKNVFDPEAIQKHAEKFSRAIFKDAVRSYIRSLNPRIHMPES